MRMTTAQKRRFTAGAEALVEWIEGTKGQAPDDDVRLGNALCTARGLRVGRPETAVGLVALQDWLARTIGAGFDHANRVASALNTVLILLGQPGECAGPACGEGLRKGPVCPACLCCRGCATAYEHKSGGRCPGCLLNPSWAASRKRPAKKRAAKAKASAR